MPFLAGLVTPQDYGAVGNGTTDDTAAIQAAINAVNTAGGGTLFFPPATYAVTPVSSTSAALTLNNGTTGYNGVRLVGASTGGSHIKKLANGPIIAMSGPSTDTTGNTHCKYCSLENLYLDGNSLTGTMVQTYYADNLLFQNVHFVNNYDIVQDTAEYWDSRYFNCVWEGCGSTTNSASTPNVLLRNSAASSGYGFSGDSVNQIYFSGCRWENFRQSAVWIQQGVSNSGNPLGIFFVNSKMESSILQGGSHLNVDTTCRGVYVSHLYCYSGGFGGGFSTAQDVITWSPNGYSALTNVVIANRTATSTVANGVTINSPNASASIAIKNVTGLYLTAPTGAHVNFGTTTGGFSVEGCYSLAGTLFSNAPTTALVDQYISNNTTGTVAIDNAGTVAGAGNADLQLIEGAAAGRAFGVKVTGDTELRYFLNAKGDASYGAGTSVDFQLLRSATGVLSLSKSLEVGSVTDLGDGSVGSLKMANATTLPTGNPSGGSVAYARNGALWARDPNGIISPMISPSEFSASPTNCLGETFPRCLGSSATATQTIGATTGTVYMMGMWLPAGLTITNINWITGTTAAGTPTHWWLGIANSAGLQQAHTADQTSGAIAASTLITKALTATYTTTTTGLYYLLLSVTATTNPTATGMPVPISQMNLATPILAGVSATTQSAPGTDGTTTYTAPASAGGIPYMYLT